LDAQLADRFDERQSRPYRALGIILVRMRIAEINEHPVAHIFGDEAVEPGDRLRDALVIGADHEAQVFRVELSRERSRVDEIGEHYGQLATLGLVLPSWLGLRGCRGCRYGNRSAAEITDRTQHFASITEQDPHFFQVLIREIRKDAEVNAIFDETLGILAHAELFEPVRNLLHRGHQGPVVACLNFGPPQHRVYTDRSAVARVAAQRFLLLSRQDAALRSNWANWLGSARYPAKAPALFGKSLARCDSITKTVTWVVADESIE
jgi:hypothetical protein